MSIIALGLLLRLIFILVVPTYPETDFMWYHMRGVELAQGKGFLNSIYPYYIGQPGFPSAFRPIGYPGTLAFFYYFFGPSFWVGKSLNLFFSFIIMLFSYKIAKIFFGKKIALLTLLLIAFSPLSISYTGILCSEVIFSAVLVFSTYILFTKNNPLILGLLIGYLSLIRPIAIFLPIIYLIYTFIKNNRNLKEKLKYASLLAVAFAIVISPWLVRNYLVFGKPFFSTNGGYVFYVNNNDFATGSWSDPFKYPNSPMLKYKREAGFDEIGLHEEGKKLAQEWIMNNPKKFFKLAFLRIKNSYWSKLDDIMWAFTTGINTWHPITSKAIFGEKILYRIFNIFLFIYIALSLIPVLKKKHVGFHTFILFVFAYFNSMMFVLEGNPRYVFPLHPLYTIGIAVVVYTYFYKLKSILSFKIIYCNENSDNI